MNYELKTIKGFTFIEVILVFTFISALAALGGINISALQSGFKLAATADEVRNLLRTARQLSLSNYNQTSYKVSLTGQVVKLQTLSGTEVSRYLSPTDVTFSPTSLTWTFAAVTGAVSGCILPCQLTLTSANNTQIVTISQSGIIN